MSGKQRRVSFKMADKADDKKLLDETEWKKMDINGVEASSPESNSMFERLFVKLYGNIPMKERYRVGWLAATLFFIIGGYWLLRSLKDPIVATIVGVEYIPKCKILSLFVVFGLVTIYNKLVDIFPKHQLFYIIGGFYAAVFFIISLLLDHPTIGIHNTEADPSRVIGWVSYCTIESFGSICISLFWAFVNSSIDLEGAKSAYGLIIAGAQIGSIMGPTIATQAVSFGIPRCYSLGSLAMALMVVMVWGYVKIFGILDEEKAGKKKKNAGVMEGAVLFWKHHYVKGLFCVSCLFMVEVTILDFSMKVLAKHEFDQMFPGDPALASRSFAAFMGKFGQVTNLISFTFSLLGTSFVIRRIGLPRTLLAFPSLCLVMISIVYLYPSLWVVFCAMMLLKGFSYALNNPCKEILYQPTSSAVKFKSKSWIDTFGARGSKAAGSLVTNAFADSLPGLLTYGSFTAMGVSAFLIFVARYMGERFTYLTENGELVGEEDEEELPKTVEVAAANNGTSCAEDAEEEAAAPTTKA
mmetsp:Transcript_18422/g.25311  ORF Transcript_18422/g.25311 Transcript_18422/m.25311 type:complete len:525 (+) Transcript_18422:66-1640(+)